MGKADQLRALLALPRDLPIASKATKNPFCRESRVGSDDATTRARGTCYRTFRSLKSQSMRQSAVSRQHWLVWQDSLDSTHSTHSTTPPVDFTHALRRERKIAVRRRGDEAGGRAEQGASKEQARSKPSPAKYQTTLAIAIAKVHHPRRMLRSSSLRYQYLRLHAESIRLDQRSSKKMVGASAPDPCNGSTHTWRGRIIYHADLSGMNVRWCSTAGALGHGRMMMLSCLPLALVRQRKGCCHMSDKAAPTSEAHLFYCMQRCSR